MKAKLDLNFSVDAVDNSGLERHIEDIKDQIARDLMEIVHETYEDVTMQLLPHLESTARRPNNRPPGDLKNAILESEREFLHPIDEGDNIFIGIGDAELLEQRAPHWKYLEYGTYDMADNWPNPPHYNPLDSASVGLTEPEHKTARGIAPNRAWRYGMYQAIAKLDYRMGKLFKRQV
jgi:hypothetical protein